MQEGERARDVGQAVEHLEPRDGARLLCPRRGRAGRVGIAAAAAADADADAARDRQQLAGGAPHALGHEREQVPALLQGFDDSEDGRVPDAGEGRGSCARRGQGGFPFLRGVGGGGDQGALVDEPDGDEREGRGRACPRCVRIERDREGKRVSFLFRTIDWSIASESRKRKKNAPISPCLFGLARCTLQIPPRPALASGLSGWSRTYSRRARGPDAASTAAVVAAAAADVAAAAADAAAWRALLRPFMWDEREERSGADVPAGAEPIQRGGKRAHTTLLSCNFLLETLKRK